MLAGHTLIDTLQGPRRLDSLIEPALSFGWDGTRVTVERVRAGPATLAPGHQVTLDSGVSIVSTPDHQYVTREGVPTSASSLAPGTGLLPLYTHRDVSGVVLYREPGEWWRGARSAADADPWRRVARLVAEYVLLKRRLGPNDLVFHRRHTDDDRPEALCLAASQQRVRPDALLASNRLPNQRNHTVMESCPTGCVSAGATIYMIEQSIITPISVERYAAESTARPILVYDQARKLIRGALGANARLVKHNQGTVRIGLSTNTWLRCTPDHQVMLADGTYVAAKDIKGRTLLMAPWGSFTPKQAGMLVDNRPGTVWAVTPAVVDTATRIYDLTTETGNFICDGVVVHNSDLVSCHSILSDGSASVTAGGVFIRPD